MNIPRTFGFYSVKIISIFIISVLYFITGSIFSLLLDEAIPDEDPKQLSTMTLLLEVSIVFGVIGVVYYLNRIAIKKMPFFLDGLFGFEYSLVHDTASGMIVGYILYAYQDNLIDLLKELRVRYTSIQRDIVSYARGLYHNVMRKPVR